MDSRIIECRSAAKINLTLDIIGRREDGFHLLQSLVHTLNWWDFLRFEPRDDGTISLSCSRSELETESNLCVRAAQLYREEAHARGINSLQGVHIVLQKNIPSGAGLGGGSGNAAATLLALNELCARVLTPQELEILAARLGADVPLFLRGGCMLMEGVGERLREMPALSGHLLLVQPHQSLETPQVYARFDALPPSPKNATPEALRILRDSAPHDASTREHSSEVTISQESRLSVLSLADCLGNDLEPAAQSLGVDIESIIAKLRACGARGAAMSGSGSCVFGLFASEEAAQAAHEKLRDSGEFAIVKVAQLHPRGIAFSS